MCDLLSKKLCRSIMVAAILLGGAEARASVINASSNGYGVKVDLSLIGNLVGATTGSLASGSGSAPAPYGPITNSLVNVNASASLGVAALTTLDVLVNPVGATSRTLTGHAQSNVDGLPGIRFTSGEGDVENLSLALKLNVLAVSTDILGVSTDSGKIIRSTTSITGDIGSLSAAQNSDLAGLNINLGGFGAVNIAVLLDVNGHAAPNTGINIPGIALIILNEQGTTGDGIHSLSAFTNAVHIELLGGGLLAGLATSDVIIGHSQAQITAVPEPSTLLLCGSALFFRRRRRSAR